MSFLPSVPLWPSWFVTLFLDFGLLPVCCRLPVSDWPPSNDITVSKLSTTSCEFICLRDLAHSRTDTRSPIACCSHLFHAVSCCCFFEGSKDRRRVTDCRAFWDKLVTFDYFNKLNLSSMTMALTDKCWILSFLAMIRSHKPAQSVMGLIILQLHGHAPYGNITVPLLCVALRGRQGSWHRLQTSTGTSLWSAWMVHWWKMEITSSPTVLLREKRNSLGITFFSISCDPDWFLC